MNEFEERITADTPSVIFFDVIKRKPSKTFKDSTVKAKMKNRAKKEELVFSEMFWGCSLHIPISIRQE